MVHVSTTSVVTIQLSKEEFEDIRAALLKTELYFLDKNMPITARKYDKLHMAFLTLGNTL